MRKRKKGKSDDSNTNSTQRRRNHGIQDLDIRSKGDKSEDDT